MLDLLPRLIAMHTANWRVRSGHTDFECPQMRAFVTALASDLPLDLIDATELRVDGVPIASAGHLPPPDRGRDSRRWREREDFPLEMRLPDGRLLVVRTSMPFGPVGRSPLLYMALIAAAIGLGAAIDYLSAIGMDGIAAHEQMVNGAAFGLSVLLLLFGLRAVLGAYGKNRHVFDSARSLVLVVTSLLGPAVLLALQFSNALDVERYRAGSAGGAVCDTMGMPVGVWLNLAITAVALVAVIGLALARRRFVRLMLSRKFKAPSSRRTPKALTLLARVAASVHTPAQTAPSSVE